jgi:hypothetical protein
VTASRWASRLASARPVAPARRATSEPPTKSRDWCPACRRYRRRQKANGISAGVTVTTVDMCALADRLETGAVTAAEMKLAAKLVMALVDRLREDSAIDVGTACD